MKKNDKEKDVESKVEAAKELTDTELDAVAGGVGDDPSQTVRVKLTGPFIFEIVDPVDLPKLP